MTVKSQTDLNKPETHSTEVLLETISKLETTTKELERTKKQLEIAKEALNEYANEDHWCGCIAGFNPREIDSGCYGVYGFSEAQEALIKIEELEK